MRTTLRFRGASPFAAAATATIAIAAATLLLCCANASAATFCVGNPSCSAGAGNNYSTVQGALTAAAGSSGTDRIEISSGTYADGPWVTGATNPVEIVGVGATRPVLSAPALTGTKVLTLNADGSGLENVAITIPAADGATGLELDKWTIVNDVSVTGAGSTNAVGIALSSHNSSVLSDSSVDLNWGPGNQSMAMTLNVASSAKIYGVTLRACTGLSVTSSNNVDMQRLRVTADNGIHMYNSSGTVSSSLLRYSTPAILGYHYGLRANVTDGSSQTVNSINNTIVTSGANAAAGVVASATSPGTANIAVNSNAIFGYNASFLLDGSGTDNVTTTYSRYDVTPPQAVGAGNALLTGDPEFTNAAGGDYSLKRDSGLVDAGDPAAIATGGQPSPSAVDLAGKDRLVNAVGADAATRDIGAYEVQNESPTAVLHVLTANPATGSPVDFSSSGSIDPDGDPLTYLWRFDDGTTVTTPTARRLWNVAGIQTVQLTVADSTGLTSTASAQVQVAKGMLTMTLPHTGAKLDRTASFRYKLTCPTAAAIQCSGRVLFMTAAKIDLKTLAVTATKRNVKAAQLVYTIKSGQTKTFVVRTYRTFLKVLKHQRKVVLQATLTGTAANVDLTAAPAKFTVSH